MRDINDQAPADSDASICSPASDSWLNLLLDEGPPDIATLWELCLTFEYDRTALVRNLSEWLGNPGGLRVLDCACGTGFPAIDLARRGYDMTCSDGSALMLGYFKRRVQFEGVPMQADQVRWEDLSSRYDEPFDVVMCRGCALPYAGTWDDETPPDRQALADCAREFAASLRAGGRLYVDTANELRSSGPELTRHRPFMIGSHTIELTEELSVDPSRRLRFWRSELTIDGQRYEFRRHSHYLPPDDLVRLLTDASLRDVRRVRMPGERYAVVTAIRGGD